MNKELTLGSLFDGSGGFPLSAIRVGIKPLWSSEIEPFPVMVTYKRLPDVLKYGDIRGLNGRTLPPVDIITAGFPCQDLSVAGKRAGLKDGERSSLFFEAIRIIKEMRDETDGKYPRLILLENVPGLLSSHKGEDFRTVLEEISKIKDETFSIPKPKKWEKSGLIVGEDLSISWRILDAQYFGVPQRRRRVFIVADFGGMCRGEILFEQEGLPRDIEESKEEGKDPTSSAKGCIGRTSPIILNDQGGQIMSVSYNNTHTLRAKSNHPPLVFENHGQDSRFKGPLKDAPTLTSNLGQGGNNQPFVVYDIRQTSEHTRNERHNIYECDTTRTIDTSGNQPTRNQGGVAICTMSKNSHFTKAEENITSSLVATDYKDPPLVSLKPVRRLTPKECGRLQGFPDYWTEDLAIEEPEKEDIHFFTQVFLDYCNAKGIKHKTERQIINWLKSPHSDSQEYKMWGNGVALPCVEFILGRICKYLSLDG